MSTLFRRAFLKTRQPSSTVNVSVVVDDVETEGTILIFGSSDSGKSVLTERLIRIIQKRNGRSESLSTALSRVLLGVLDDLRLVAKFVSDHEEHFDTPEMIDACSQIKHLDESSVIEDGSVTLHDYIKVSNAVCSPTAGIMNVLATDHLNSSRAKPLKLMNFYAATNRLTKKEIEKWDPNDETFLICSPRTTGMKFKRLHPSILNHLKMRIGIYDLGGAKNERRKWNYVLSKRKEDNDGSPSVILFCVSLVGLDLQAFEDNLTTQHADSIQAFQMLKNHEIFKSSQAPEIIICFKKRNLVTEFLKHPKSHAFLKNIGYDYDIKDISIEIEEGYVRFVKTFYVNSSNKHKSFILNAIDPNCEETLKLWKEIQDTLN